MHKPAQEQELIKLLTIPVAQINITVRAETAGHSATGIWAAIICKKHCKQEPPTNIPCTNNMNQKQSITNPKEGQHNKRCTCYDGAPKLTTESVA